MAQQHSTEIKRFFSVQHTFENVWVSEVFRNLLEESHGKGATDGIGVYQHVIVKKNDITDAFFQAFVAFLRRQ
jgi:hypothetical protein